MIELAGILVLGFLAQWFAWRIKVPAILPLILIGLLVGPISSLLTSDGSKFIDGDKIFHGDLLFDAINIAVGLILFEGGLTLKLKEISTLGRTIRNLLIATTVITLFGGAFAAHTIMGISYRTAFLFGALVIVTGPTVIGPILRNVRANHNVSTLLKWEGILIDPIGALIAILIYEFVVSGKPNEQFTLFALKEFLFTILSGGSIGIIFSFFIYQILKKKLIPDYLRNVVILGLVIMTFAVSDLIHQESGLLAVTLLGMILANLKLDNLKQILSFKEDVTLILISFLFVMLSSRMEMKSLMMLLELKSILLFAIIVFVLRPIAIFLSTIGSGLNIREKVFLSYICPRGIVAAGVASIFTVRLVDASFTDVDSYLRSEATLLLPLTFMIIVGTVVIQGATAKPVAKLLGVNRKAPDGVLFLGANEIARFLAKYLRSQGIPVLLADTSQVNIQEAKSNWLPVKEGSLLNEEVIDEIDFSRFGQLYALTSNTEINILGNRLLGQEVGDSNVYRIGSNKEVHIKGLSLPENLLFQGKLDYISSVQFFRQNPKVKIKKLLSKKQLDAFIEKDNSILPLFLYLAESKKITPATTKQDLEITEGDQLIFIQRE